LSGEFGYFCVVARVEELGVAEPGAACGGHDLEGEVVGQIVGIDAAEGDDL
jgi:hypothetical protein